MPINRAFNTGRAAIDAVLDRVMSEDIEAQTKRVTTGFWSTLKKAARRIPFIEDVVAAYFVALDPKVPFKSRAIIIGALAYFVLPIDAVPDVLMLIGFGDDIAVLTMAIAAIRSNMTEEHYEKARAALADSDLTDDEIKDTSGDREPTDAELKNVTPDMKV